MPTKWAVNEIQQGVLGTFQIVIHPPGQPSVDVTYWRGVPTTLQSYSFADPFGPATAVINFPQMTVFDDRGSGDTNWLRDFADVDIYLVPPNTDPNSPVNNPVVPTTPPTIKHWPKFLLSDEPTSDMWWSPEFLGDVYLPNYQTKPPPPPPIYGPVPGTGALDARTKVWEGFIASIEWNQDAEGSSVTIQCQGAAFQVDKYVQAPFFPPRPWPYESLIARCFDRKQRPHLRTKPLKIEWPAGWSKKAPNYGANPNVYAPIGTTPGQNITGYSGRNTGSWDKSLTSYIQSLLNVMYTDTGEQWTIRLDEGRQPVLYVRQFFNQTPTYVMHAAQPGIASMDFTRDLTQYANIIFGTGTDTAGAQWSRQQVSENGAVTEYEPIAWDAEVWPTVGNPRLSLHQMRVETYTKFDNGFDEQQAVTASEKMLQRDMDPGLAGSLTLDGDPTDANGNSLSRFLMRAGETILLKYLVGTGTRGVLLHISEVDVNVQDGSVELKVDSKFRDLLTLEEVLVRTRDPLTPVSLLQIGKRSILIEDQLAPWDYHAGSGFIPKRTTGFFTNKPNTSLFPYRDWTSRYPPKKYPGYYTMVKAGDRSRYNRWTCVPIRLSEKGTIRLTQVACYDASGNVLPIPFHFSVYYHQVNSSDMPFDGHGPSPFLPDAFQSTTQYGISVPAGTPGWTFFAQDALIIGWGHAEQPAGYSPGMKTMGDPLTGLLLDEVPWTYDCTNNPDFDKNPKVGQREKEDSITAWGMFYAEWHENVYFMGRFFRQEPGT